MHRPEHLRRQKRAWHELSENISVRSVAPISSPVISLNFLVVIELHDNVERSFLLRHLFVVAFVKTAVAESVDFKSEERLINAVRRETDFFHGVLDFDSASGEVFVQTGAGGIKSPVASVFVHSSVHLDVISDCVASYKIYLIQSKVWRRELSDLFVHEYEAKLKRTAKIRVKVS